MPLDALVAELAADQHGLITRAQATALGLTSSSIGRRLQSGRWRRTGHGVYAIAGSVRSWEQDLLGLCLAGRGVASHRSAAALWCIAGFLPGVLELTVRRGGERRPGRARVHQSTDLDRIEPVLRRGIPTTPLDRTVLDLGAVLRFEDYLLVVERVVRSGALTWRDLLDVLVRHARRGRDGVGRLRAALEDGYGATPTDSDFEVLVERLLRDAGLPRPVRQHVVVDRTGRPVARIDLAFPAARLAIELDGRAYHSDPTAFERDRSRQNELVLLGWTVLRFTWQQFLDRPDRLVAEVRAALGRNGRPRTR